MLIYFISVSYFNWLLVCSLSIFLYLLLMYNNVNQKKTMCANVSQSLTLAVKGVRCKTTSNNATTKTLLSIYISLIFSYISLSCFLMIPTLLYTDFEWLTHKRTYHIMCNTLPTSRCLLVLHLDKHKPVFAILN